MQTTSCKIQQDESQAGIKIARRNINNLRYADEVKVKSLNHAHSATLGTIAHQAPPSMGFSRQEYWSGLPFPSAGDLPNPGIKLRSPELAGGFFNAEPPGIP